MNRYVLETIEDRNKVTMLNEMDLLLN